LTPKHDTAVSCSAQWLAAALRSSKDKPVSVAFDVPLEAGMSGLKVRLNRSKGVSEINPKIIEVFETDT
jgi:hypothetical protein